ncbi:MAG: hypothetical protein ABIO24_07690 [Saprospiraceae bacterium]
MRTIFLLGLVLCLHTLAYGQSAFSNVAIKFPDDMRPDHCILNSGAPILYNPDSLNLVVTYNDWFVTPAPDACISVERDWYVANSDFYNPALGCINVPNPQPALNPNNVLNLPAPILSAPGTPAPWTSSIMKIAPTDPGPTDFSGYWSATANCYRYHQSIKVLDWMHGTSCSWIWTGMVPWRA